MKLTTPMQITAADSESRIITGKIIQFEEAGNASTGKVIFAKGSIEPADVMLNLEHDRTRRIGKPLQAELSADKSSITSSWKISNTTAGTDAIVEAMDGLRDGLSVEVSVNDYIMEKDGTMRVLSGELTGVGLVAEPAIRSARVTDVAASEEDSESTPASEENPSTEGDEVSENTVTSADAVETVEAAQAATEAVATTPRYKVGAQRVDLSAGVYLQNKVMAQLGDEDAKRYVHAADNTTDNAGFIRTPQLSNVINGLSTFVRPTIEAISSGSMPADGLTFEIPKITVAPTAAITAEDAAFDETDQNSAFLTVTKKKFTSQQKFSVELLTLSNPAFYERLVINMNAAIAKAQDAYANAQVLAGATADTTTVTTYPTAAELLGFVARGASSIYENTIGLPNPFAVNLIGNTKQWANIIGLNDNGRPIYSAAQPMNAGGAVSGRARRGMVADMDFYVTANTAAGTDTDGSLVLVNPDAYTWYEDPTQYQLRAESTADGSITIGLYSFGAVSTNIAAGAYKINKA